MNAKHPQQHDRLMGLDVGGRRIGVAVADELGIFAAPVGFVTRGAGDRKELGDLIARFGITRLVVGLPASLSGREGPQAADVRDYASEIAGALGLPVTFWDERLTTTIAERAMIERGVRREKRKEQIDAAAAAVMLQGYLDAQAHRRRRQAG